MMIKKVALMMALTLLMPLLAVPGVTAQNVESLVYPELNKIKIPDVEQVTLDNGMRVYLLVDKSLPVVSARARINCGSYLEPAEKVGLASICGTVMRTGGTEKWTGDEIDRMLEGIGATVETGIGTASASAYVNCLSEYVDTGLAVLAQVLRYPVFDQDKIDLAKMQVRTSIARRNDFITAIADREFEKLIYGAASPYARHVEYATLEAITRDDLVNFHLAYFHPDNIQLAVWGDFDKKEMLKKIDKLFGFWPAIDLPVPTLPPVEYEWRSKVYYIEKTDVEQAYVKIGHLGGLVSDPDYADRVVMNTIMGDGFGSRITDGVRTKLGLAYSTEGSFDANISYPGVFWAYASTKPSSTIQAAREIIKQIKSMQTDPPTEAEMRKGKDGFLNSFVFNFDSKSEVINRMMNYDFFGLPADFLHQLRDKVEKVTPEAVQQAAINNLKPDQLVVLVVGNAAEFGQPLDSLGLGPVDTIDITIPPPPAPKQEQAEASEQNIEKGKAFLARAIELAGGLDNFKKIKNVSAKSSAAVKTEQQELTIELSTDVAYPDKKRNEMVMFGVSIYDVCNGEVGWKTGPTGDVIEMSEAEVEEANKDIQRDVVYIFQRFDDPYYQPVYSGRDAIGDIPIEYVSIVNDEGDAICRLGFGPDGRLVCRSYYGMTTFGPGMLDDVYVDFMEVEGVLMPKTIQKVENGTLMATITVSEINVNTELAPDVFQKPE